MPQVSGASKRRASRDRAVEGGCPHIIISAICHHRSNPYALGSAVCPIPLPFYKIDSLQHGVRSRKQVPSDSRLTSVIEEHHL
jgi:hypothetical protein